MYFVKKNPNQIINSKVLIIDSLIPIHKTVPKVTGSSNNKYFNFIGITEYIRKVFKF